MNQQYSLDLLFFDSVRNKFSSVIQQFTHFCGMDKYFAVLDINKHFLCYFKILKETLGVFPI
jgi:hypothetical protein